MTIFATVAPSVAVAVITNAITTMIVERLAGLSRRKTAISVMKLETAPTSTAPAAR